MPLFSYNLFNLIVKSLKINCKFVLLSCDDLATVSSARCDFDELCGLDSALEMSCRSNGEGREVHEAGGGSGGTDESEVP